MTSTVFHKDVPCHLINSFPSRVVVKSLDKILVSFPLNDDLH